MSPLLGRPADKGTSNYPPTTAPRVLCIQEGEGVEVEVEVHGITVLEAVMQVGIWSILHGVQLQQTAVQELPSGFLIGQTAQVLKPINH